MNAVIMGSGRVASELATLLDREGLFARHRETASRLVGQTHAHAHRTLFEFGVLIRLCDWETKRLALFVFAGTHETTPFRGGFGLRSVKHSTPVRARLRPPATGSNAIGSAPRPPAC